MFDWMSPTAFIQTLARVVIVWLAFYGAGKILLKPLKVHKVFPLLPPEIVGMLAFVLLTIPLSLLGVMNRSVCPPLLLLMAIPGALFGYGRLREKLPGIRPGVLHVLMALFLGFVLMLNFTNASMPNIRFDDPLITYAVQPDRWLNRGGIYWLEETAFSGFPLLYEMTAVWPASLSSDRMNQLSVLQVFQMSLLVLAVFRGLGILKICRKLWLPVAAIVLLTTSLYIICSMAKTDTMALLFCTLALAAAVRQGEKGFTGSPLTSWLCMGMALASKQTAIVVVIPFLLYSARAFLRLGPKWKALALGSLLMVPGAYGVRTMLKTGSPTYPVYPVSSLLREGWDLEDPEENALLNDRSSYLHAHKNFPLMKHAGIFFGYMEGNFLLLLAGAGVVLLSGRAGKALLTLPVVIYGIIAIAVFWPPWWGAKYAVLIFPFTGLLGAKLLNGGRSGAIATIFALLVAFVVPGYIAVAIEDRPIFYRTDVMASVLRGGWRDESRFGMLMSTPEGMTHMWANSFLPPETVIFSILEEKRYFFDGTVIVGWRHPLGQKLYHDNTLEDEIAILDGLNVDYVGFYRDNPAILRQEDRLAILDHVGTGQILEPVIIVNDGYMLCRYNGSFALP